MAKFCGKCGTRLDEITGLCPNCDAEKIKENSVQEEPITATEQQDVDQTTEKPLSKKEAKKKRKAAKKAKKKEKWAKLTTGQKVRKFFLKLFWKLILLVILAIGSCSLMVYYGFLDIPIVDEILNEIGVISYSEFAGQDINESYIPNSENIVYQNESNSFGYVNNMILVFFTSSASEEKINDAVNSINGTVVGRIDGINQYQIQVEPMEREELDAVCEFLMENESVKYAIVDTVITMDSSVIPNDPWKDAFQGLWGVDWDENNPDGYNWWIEAVKIPSAWEYNDVLNPINVGIVDNGFDTNHEDLNLTVLNSEVNNAENHGTHVAGVIGATINNETGISGILDEKTLYCVDCYATSKQKKSNIAVSSLMDGIVTCLDNNCKVINMSSGTKFTSKAETAESAKESARYATIYLFAMLDSYEDFIIVQSAGNGNKAGVGVDAYKYNGYFASIDDEIIQSVLDEFKEKEVVLNRDITTEDIKNSYIIVGAVDAKKKKNNWQLSEFSNYGNSITVCAPGVDVFSTIVSGGIDGSYGNMDGTSMAAPIVSGIAAMVWSVDPAMSAEQVHAYITDSATEVVSNRNKNDNGTYYLVNANEAVKAAISDLENKEASEQKGQFEDTDILDGAVEFNGHWYKVIQDDLVNDWNSALQYCANLNGYLATITSQEENNFLYSYISQEGYSSAYFGLSDSINEGTWIWCNGEQSSYTNWHNNEPNGENSNEDYALFYYKYSDGTWNDGDFGNQTANSGTAFICEWGEYEIAPQIEITEPVRTTSDERDIVLVLDVSGSMSGTPMEETKKASVNFVDTILDEDASIGIVTYDNSASRLSDFSVNQDALISAVSGIWDGGGTNIESGLAEAHAMLSTSSAKKKIIVLMSDGEPNDGKEGDDLIAYANEIKNDDIIIYTLGFFESLGSYKSSAQMLMEDIASDGCHYEVANADDLVFFFEDMADQINGQKYIYIRIACPVDVSVTYNGETLSSAEDDLTTRTDFGTLTFEENENVTDADEDDRIKVLRLKEGADYDVEIVGTGHGIMDYTIGFMDENGDYSDFRRFEDIKITRRTKIDTVATVSKDSVLNIDEDGDGRYDLKLRADENGYGEEVDDSMMIYVAIGGGVLLLLLIVVCVAMKKRKNKKTKENN